ncbi:MAG: hypothetical protein K2V38_17855, partial [Gemmataceae bacterium]|nr:hypothetical protein [Gemmataceae bacterium]
EMENVMAAGKGAPAGTPQGGYGGGGNTALIKPDLSGGVNPPAPGFGAPGGLHRFDVTGPPPKYPVLPPLVGTALPGRPNDAKGQTQEPAGPGAVSGGAAVRGPETKAMPVPGPVGPGGKDAGWEPGRPGAVTSGDLARFAPLPVPRNTTRGSTDRDADAVKKATDRASAYSDERQRKLSASVEAYSTARGLSNALPELPNGQQVLNNFAWAADKVEALALQRVREAVPPAPPLVVREFAAPRPALAPLPDAPEPTDTVLWQPVIVVPSDGKAVLNFAVGHAPGGYRLVVAGHTTDGRLGEARLVIPGAAPTPPTQAVPTGAVPLPAPLAPGARP